MNQQKPDDPMDHDAPLGELFDAPDEGAVSNNDSSPVQAEDAHVPIEAQEPGLDEPLDPAEDVKPYQQHVEAPERDLDELVDQGQPEQPAKTAGTELITLSQDQLLEIVQDAVGGVTGELTRKMGVLSDALMNVAGRVEDVELAQELVHRPALPAASLEPADAAQEGPVTQVDAEQADREREAAERGQADAEEAVRLVAERDEAEAAEAARLAREQADREAAEREEVDAAEAARIAAEQAEQTKSEHQEFEGAPEREEGEAAEAARLAAEAAEREESEAAEAARVAAEAAEREEAEAAEAARLAAEAAEREEADASEAARVAAEAAEREETETARLAAEAAEREETETARLAAEAAEREEAEATEAARLAAEAAEREEAEAAEATRLVVEQAEREEAGAVEAARVAAEQAERDRQEAEAAEVVEREEVEAAEAARLAAEHADRERQEADAAEAARLAAEQAAVEPGPVSMGGGAPLPEDSPLHDEQSHFDALAPLDTQTDTTQGSAWDFDDSDGSDAPASPPPPAAQPSPMPAAEPVVDHHPAPPAVTEPPAPVEAAPPLPAIREPQPSPADSEPQDLLFAIAVVDPEAEQALQASQAATEMRKTAQANVQAEKRGRRQKQRWEPLPLDLITPGQPLIAAVYSPSGGVGKSSTAMNMGAYTAMVAARMAQDKNGAGDVTRVPRVVVVDGNIVHGSLSLRLTGEIKPSMHTLQLYMDSRLDAGFTGEHTWPSRYEDAAPGEKAMKDFVMWPSSVPNLNLLAAPDEPEKFYDFGPREYHEILTMLGRFYDVIVIDCGTELIQESQRAWLSHAHQVFLITAPEIDKLYNAQKAARSMVKRRPHPQDQSDTPELMPPLASREKLAVVLTRADADTGLDPQDALERNFSRFIEQDNWFYMLDVHREMTKANNTGHFLVSENPKYAEAVGGLVQHMFRRYTQARGQRSLPPAA